MEEAKARWQQEAAQKRTKYQDHMKIMELFLFKVPSSQAMQDLRNQRELEIQKDAFLAKNKILEEQLAKQQQSDEELRIAKERLSPQTIDVDQILDNEEDVEQFFDAAQHQVSLVDGFTGVPAQAFGPTQDGLAASQDSQ